MVEIIRKINGYISKILKHILKREFALGFYYFALEFPRSLLHFNQATLLKAENLKMPDNINPEIEVKMADKSDVEIIRQIGGSEKNHIEKMLESNGVCFLASLDGKCGSIGWAALDKCYVKGLGYLLDYDHPFHYTYALYTLPEARRKGMNLAILKKSFELAGQRGIKDLYSIVELTNDYALAFHFKLGFEAIAKISFLKICCLKITREKSFLNNRSKYRFFIKEPKKDMLLI